MTNTFIQRAFTVRVSAASSFQKFVEEAAQKAISKDCVAEESITPQGHTCKVKCPPATPLKTLLAFADSMQAKHYETYLANGTLVVKR